MSEFEKATELGLKRQPFSRMEAFTRLTSRVYLKSPRIKGLEYLAEMPTDSGFIVATTHLSVIDVQTIAGDISKYRKIGIASQQVNQDLFMVGGLIRFGFEGRVYNITGGVDQQTQRGNFKLDPANFEIMSDQMSQGLGVVIAAHMPVNEWRLPNIAGVGATLLSHLTESPILPATLEIDDTSLSPNIVFDHNAYMGFLLQVQPGCQITYGEPIYPKHIDKDDLEMALNYFSDKGGKSLNDEERVKAFGIGRVLKKEGMDLMKRIARPLSPEKRGKW